jgi:hypothetical protein
MTPIMTPFGPKGGNDWLVRIDEDAIRAARKQAFQG